jgi:TRAP-type C4-dicarboxylate transport system permease small subunit
VVQAMGFVYWLSNLLKKVAGTCLLGMMLLTCADVVSGMFGHPILGSEEIVGLMAAVVLAFALPATQIENAHVGVDLLVRHLPQKVKYVNDKITLLACFIFFLLVAWQCYLYADKLRNVGQVSSTLKLPTYLLIYGVAFSCLILALVILVEFLTPKKEITNE